MIDMGRYYRTCKEKLAVINMIQISNANAPDVETVVYKLSSSLYIQEAIRMKPVSADKRFLV